MKIRGLLQRKDISVCFEGCKKRRSKLTMEIEEGYGET